jgi:peptidoglycan/LPS O-acetylase OafA/YrhL
MAMTTQGATADAGLAAAGGALVQAGENRVARIESLRAVAALAVLVSHVFLYSRRFGPTSFDTWLHRSISGGGIFGVQLFFALSGFLIFRPFAERDYGQGGPIDLRSYAWNRAVRILPLYWCAVAVLLVFTQDGGSLTQWLRFTTLTQQFFADTAQTVDGVMWTLVVELHFYLLLPFLATALARVCARRRQRAAVALVLLGAASVALFRLGPDPEVVWQHSLPATFYGFVPGMLLALLAVGWREQRPTWLRSHLGRADLWLVASIPVWLACFWDYDWDAPLTAVAAFLTVGAVVLPLEPGRVVRALDWRPLALVGVASYSLYIWHVPIIEQLYLRPALTSFPALLAVATPLALVVAAVSYVLVEHPALRLRRRWAVTSPRTGGASEAAWTDRLGPDQRWLLLLGAVGFLVRARVVFATSPLVLGADPLDYDRLGRLVAAGEGFGESLLSPSGGPTAFRAPLYPWFLGASYEVSGGSITAARLAQAALGVLTVVLVFLVARRLFGRGAALASAAIAAVYPPLVLATVALMSEAIFVPIMLGALLMALLAREGGPRATWWAAGCGAAVGSALLARPNGMAMVPALVVLAAAWGRRSADRDRTGLVRAVAVVGCAVAVVLPWEVRTAAALDAFVPISDIDGYNVAGVYNADSANAPWPSKYQFRPPSAVAAFGPLFVDRTLDEVSLGSELRAAGIDWISEHPSAPVEAFGWNSLRMLELAGLDNSAAAAAEYGYGRRTAALGMVSFWLLLLAAAAGLARSGARRAPLVLWAAPVCLWLGSALFLGDARIRAPIDVFLVLAAGAWTSEVVVRGRARRRGRELPETATPTVT